jgi:hypothetical protein
MVVGKLPLMGPSSYKFSVHDVPHTAKPCFSFRDLTAVLAQGTGETVFITRRFWRKAVGPATPGMNLGYFRPDFREMMTDAISAEPNHV